MPALLLASPEPLSGKTTFAVGLCRTAMAAGRTVSLLRLAGDANAAPDTALFESLPGVSGDPASADIVIIEAPAGDPSGAMAGVGDARVIVVAPADSGPVGVAEYCRGLGAALAGVIVNKVPQRRAASLRKAFEGAGVRLLVAVPEDRVLAAPVLGDLAAALDARVSFMNGDSLRPLDRPLIASIAVDPGQGYFARCDATAVIVRSDKPDLQLGAINAGAGCLIITGVASLLTYVLDRAEEDQIPLLRTDLGTVEVMGSIEALFGSRPFAGGAAKLSRLDELLAGLDIDALIGG